MFSPLSPPAYSSNENVWSKLNHAATAIAILSSVQRRQGANLVVVEDTRTALRLEQELTALGNGMPGVSPIIHFPDWETLPYDHFSPNADIVSDRLEALYRLSSEQSFLIVVPINTLMTRLAPRGYVDSNSLILKLGERFNIDTFRSRLENTGYHRVDTVLEHGEYAIRGSLVDIFAMGSLRPYRIDLFDEEIESIRTFDPTNQRTLETINEVKLLPAHEFPLDDQGIRRFRDQWHANFDVDHKRCSVYQDVCASFSPPGIEYYLSLFHDQLALLLDYFPDSALLYLVGDLHHAAEKFWLEASARYDNLNVDSTRPLLAPLSIYESVDQLFGRIKSFASIKIRPETGPLDANTTALPDLSSRQADDNPLSAVQAFAEQSNHRFLFCTESTGRQELLAEQLSKHGIAPTTVASFWEFLTTEAQHGILVAPIDHGVILPGVSDQSSLAVISEADLYGIKPATIKRRKKFVDATDQVIKHLTELALDAPVVHIDHGVGRYRGLETIEIDGETNEFLTLEYADNAKLYVPVANLHLISRFSGADENLAPLHRLGTDHWDKAKRKAAEKARDVAAELLNIYAQRAAKKGSAFPAPEELYRQFADSFPFDETPDQQQAIDAVVADMTSAKPMDRLVCGDVGFGKTEVAMRAAFIAATAGKQVAVMVPTTLLAQQHYDNFLDRMAQWPVKIGVLSRFQTTKETDATLSALACGQIDIVIGTHKLIQNDVKYQNLGLVIIDEEHRFGVRQKDKFKSIRAEIDVLALTATPIPRTLNLSMQGVRDLSIIATPPSKRLSIKTFVQEQQSGLVKEAVLREILRGGQVYYLHNEVKTIERIAQELRDLIPEARVGIGHGQMRERELEAVMNDFYHKRFNVLVATTIIETGLDIPNANTIIIERADKFGLAQLHQLRGRVGRSHHQAYAYLLTPPEKKLSGDAAKRLEAIAAASDLGAGFTLATHDLEIRGAGELLGDEQSGQIQHVGFSLYMEMLDKAVKAIKSGKLAGVSLEREEESEVNLRIPALIPDDYLPDVNQRLMLYKRLANTENDEQLRELQVEIIDRFGLLPEPTKNLIRVTQLRFLAEKIGIKRIEANVQQIKVEFKAETQVNPITIVNMVQKAPHIYRLEGANILKLKADLVDPSTKLDKCQELIGALAG